MGKFQTNVFAAGDSELLRIHQTEQNQQLKLFKQLGSGTASLRAQ